MNTCVYIFTALPQSQDASDIPLPRNVGIVDYKKAWIKHRIMHFTSTLAFWLSIARFLPSSAAKTVLALVSPGRRPACARPKCDRRQLLKRI